LRFRNWRKISWQEQWLPVFQEKPAKIRKIQVLKTSKNFQARVPLVSLSLDLSSRPMGLSKKTSTIFLRSNSGQPRKKQTLPGFDVKIS
jgi:hypothetical protein